MESNHVGSIRRYQRDVLFDTCLFARNPGKGMVISWPVALISHLLRRSSQSLSAMRNFLYPRQICIAGYGINIRQTGNFLTYGYLPRYLSELIDEAWGILV